jgi:hypothetical protein
VNGYTYICICIYLHGTDAAHSIASCADRFLGTRLRKPFKRSDMHAPVTDAGLLHLFHVVGPLLPPAAMTVAVFAAAPIAATSQEPMLRYSVSGSSRNAVWDLPVITARSWHVRQNSVDRNLAKRLLEDIFMKGSDTRGEVGGDESDRAYKPNYANLLHRVFPLIARHFAVKNDRIRVVAHCTTRCTECMHIF